MIKLEKDGIIFQRAEGDVKVTLDSLTADDAPLLLWGQFWMLHEIHKQLVQLTQTTAIGSGASAKLLEFAQHQAAIPHQDENVDKMIAQVTDMLTQVTGGKRDGPAEPDAT
jgi:hypothetical protein